jgi:RHS repeat-associated protein
MIARSLFAALVFSITPCIRLCAEQFNLFLTVSNASPSQIYTWVDGYDCWWGNPTHYEIYSDPLVVDPGCSDWVVACQTDFYIGLEIEWHFTVHISDLLFNEVATFSANGYINTTNDYTEVQLATYNGHPEVDPANPQKDDASRGEPFNVINGAAFRNETDLAIPARGLPLTFGRSYNSSSDSGGAEFGPGWRASTDWALEAPADEQALLCVRDGEGRTFNFVKRDYAWYCDCDVRLHVNRNGNEWSLDGRDGGAIMNFDANGRWNLTSDRVGNTLTPSRDNDGRLTNIAHSCGLSIAVSWTNDRVASVTGPDGLLRVDFAYTPSGVLTSAVRRAASGEILPRTYYYNSMGELTNAVNALGQAVTFSYATQSDGSRRCVGNAYGDGTAAANAVYDISNRSVTITYPVSDSTGRIEVTRLVADEPRIASVEMGGESLAYLYDQRTLEATSLVWSVGSQTAAVAMVLDDAGRPVSSAFRLGASPGPESHTEWSATLDLPRAQVDPLGWRTEYFWTNGLPTAVRQTNGLGGWIGTSLSWVNCELYGITDPNGQYTSFWRNNRGNVIRILPPVGPSLAISNDILGRPVSFSLPAEVSDDREWSFEYNGFGRIVRAVDPDGLDTRQHYDALGHMTGMVDRAGRYTAITYGTAGKPLHVERTVTEGGSNRTVSLDFDYNLQLEPTAIRDSLGRTVESHTTDAAGRVAEVTNVEGRAASVEYGVLGLPLAVTRFDGSRVTFGYDGGARLTALGLPGRTNTYAWLANGLLASASNSGTTVTNEWIAPGRLAAQETRALGWTGRVAYGYDLAGSVTQTVASTIGLTQTIGGDAGGRESNRIAACRGTTLSTEREYTDWNGLPLLASAGPIEQYFGWDCLDRLTNLTWMAQDTVVRTMDFSFDALGRITQRVDRAAGTVVLRCYAYDDLDRLISETKSQQPGITNLSIYSYDDAGRRTAKTSTGFDLQYANGTGDRLAGWVVTRTNTPSCTVAGTASESIGTDPRYGRREVSGGIQTATSAVNGSNFSAQVAFGSLGAKTVVASVSDAAGNVGTATNSFVLAAYTAGDYLSDDAGCVTQIVYAGAEDWHERVLSWDSEYRLTAVATNGGAAEAYGYDPFGRRIWTAAAGVTNWHLYDGPHVLADLNATGGMIRTYLYGPGIDELIAMTVYTGTVAQTYYAIRDHQNTVWAWVDAKGAVVESYDFDAWGRVLEVFDAFGAPLNSEHSRIGNRYLWQGREYSWKTGLYFFRARWYDPVTGRWLSNDPIGISGGLNQYVFCGNDPVNNRDPFGLKIRLRGTPEQRNLLLATMRQFVRGELNMNAGGYLTRKTCSEDKSYDEMISELINAKSIYGITMSKAPFFIIGGAFDPYDWAGGTIYLEATQPPYSYSKGFLRSASEPGTLGTTLAHELVHAYQNNSHQPGADLRFSGEYLHGLNVEAVEKANLVYPRMGKPTRNGTQ